MPLRTITPARNPVAPLVLRLALAAIFIVSGWHKIMDRDNDLGAMWAVNMSQRNHEPPQAVQDTLKRWEEINTQKREQGKLAEGVEPALGDKSVRETMDRIRRAYAEVAEADPVTQEGGAIVHLNSSVQLLVAWGELVGGAALLLGLLTRWAALGEFIIQLGAIYMVTWAQSFSNPAGGGWWFNLALCAMCLALVLAGGGVLALDHLIFRGQAPAGPGPVPATPPAPTPVMQ